MRSFTAAVALSALTMVAAQNSTEFTIDINQVSATTRNSWCIAQENTCTELCGSSPDTNSCDYNTLDYSCTCQNGSEPGLQYYKQTIDTFVCEEAFAECNADNVGDSTAQQNCTTSIADKCGSLDPADADTSTSTSASASSGTASATASGSTASSTAASSSTSAAGAAPTNFQHIGTGAAAAAVGLLAYML